MKLLGVKLFTFNTEDKYLQLVFQLCHDRQRSLMTETITYFYTLKLKTFFSFEVKEKRPEPEHFEWGMERELLYV